MIKAIVDGPDGPTLILGLSDLNVSRLRAGQPILFDLGSLGYRLEPVGPESRPNGHRVIIAHGKTEQAIAREFRLPDLGPPVSGVERIIFNEPG